MAAFAYDLACVFNQAGRSANFSQNVTQTPLSGTVQDDGADTAFSVNEVVADPGLSTLFPDYAGPPGDPEPTVVGSYSTSSDLWLVVLVPNSSPNASGQSGTDNLVFYGPAGADKSLLPTNQITIDGDIDQNDVPQCFAAGTLILTPRGERQVEELVMGDQISTADGKTVAVKWIGRQSVHKLFTPAERFVPVRVTAGALDNDLPHTDLVITADHALIIDDLAINAGALVNGTTIAYEPIDTLPERITYYHIETEDHDVILANGAPAETYVDYVQRRVFDNYQEYVDLYGEERTIAEM
ncbi:Hint domain-containing protein, partial [Cognatishimia sp. F0-27]|uniref:Hint domain-containing protein n=1 Tax=Cognatishimia sp. F0-27 TaxID=2816855 RepID=UPI001D0C9E3C